MLLIKVRTQEGLFDNLKYHFLSLPIQSPEGRIRTSEGKTQQIYSLPPLATWVPLVDLEIISNFRV